MIADQADQEQIIRLNYYDLLLISIYICTIYPYITTTTLCQISQSSHWENLDFLHLLLSLIINKIPPSFVGGANFLLFFFMVKNEADLRFCHHCWKQINLVLCNNDAHINFNLDWNWNCRYYNSKIIVVCFIRGHNP